jgi:plastocyanin
MSWRRSFAALVVVSAVLAGCGDDDDDGDEGAAEALEISAVDYAFEGLPEEVPGGNVTVHLTNDGEAPHEIAFVDIGDESNADSFFDDFGPVIQGGAPWPDYVGNVAGANEAEPGADFTATYQLEPGTYMVFCALTGTPEDP